MPDLILSTPCYGGLVTHRYMLSAINLLLAGLRHRFPVTIDLHGDSLVTRARNTLVARFLDRPEATHLLFVDADIGFDPQDVLRMLDFDVGVVGGLYPLKTLDWSAAAIARVQGGEAPETAPLRYVGRPCEGAARRERDGFLTASHAGTGFLLIRRDVLERMIAAHPELRYAAAHDGEAVQSANLAALFDGSIDPATRVYLSEDYTFCARWRALGGEVWIDTRACLSHTGAHEFRGAPGVRFGEERRHVLF